MYPSSGSTYGYINAPSVSGTATIGVNSGSSFGNQTTLWLFSDHGVLSFTDVGSATPIGGTVRVDDGGATVEARNVFSERDGGFVWCRSSDLYAGISTPEGKDAFFFVSAATERMTWKGLVEVNQPHGGRAAIFFDKEVWNGGAVTLTYGASMLNNMCAVGSFTRTDGGYNNTLITHFYSATATGITIATGINGINGQYAAIIFRSDQS
jgi:hypothetical protein